MWPTDRVRVCVRELCRMNGLAYIPVTREEGLVLLASFAHISVATLTRINPVAYIKAYLDDCEGDQIELIIKMCQMLGPYTYRILAQGSLDIIKEEVPVVVSEPLSVINEEEVPETEEEEDPETAVTILPPIVSPQPIITIEPIESIEPIETIEPIEPIEPIKQQQVKEVSSSCCCFSFQWPRKR